MRALAALFVMRHAAQMKLSLRALAIVLAVVGHGFLLNLGNAPTTILLFAYLGSVACLWAAAALLWRRTMQRP